MADKPLIYFDVGAVMLELNYSKLYEEYTRLTGKPSEPFKKKYAESRLEFLSLKGEISNDEFISGVGKLIEELGTHGLSRQTIDGFLESALGKEISGVINLKQRVFEAGYFVGLLTNTNDIGQDYIKKNFPRILETFDPRAPIIRSHEVKTLKPELAIYQEADKRARELEAKRIIFIDDREAYLTVPVETFDWKGIWYREHIDPLEAIKHEPGHSGETKPSDKLFVADSVQELEQVLKDLGIKI